MGFTHVFIVGFSLGVLVAGISFLAVIAKYKSEALWAWTKLRSANNRIKQGEKQQAILRKGMVDAHAENEYLKVEVDRLRDQKLDAWDIPDGI